MGCRCTNRFFTIFLKLRKTILRLLLPVNVSNDMLVTEMLDLMVLASAHNHKVIIALIIIYTLL